MALLEFSLTHDGQNWIASRENICVRGRSLPDLDEALRSALIANDMAPGKKNIKVRMIFDNSVIPQWIRQYSNHYFNRIVKFELLK